MTNLNRRWNPQVAMSRRQWWFGRETWADTQVQNINKGWLRNRKNVEACSFIKSDKVGFIEGEEKSQSL